MFGTWAAAVVETTECGCCPRCVLDAVVVDGYDDFEEPPFVEYGPADIEWLAADGDWSAEPARAVPEEIDLLPPGRRLADLLEQITDRSALSDAELVAVLAARARQLAHLQAQLLADMVAVARRCHPASLSRRRAPAGGPSRSITAPTRSPPPCPGRAWPAARRYQEAVRWRR